MYSKTCTICGIQFRSDGPVICGSCARKPRYAAQINRLTDACDTLWSTPFDFTPYQCQKLDVAHSLISGVVRKQLEGEPTTTDEYGLFMTAEDLELWIQCIGDNDKYVFYSLVLQECWVGDDLHSGMRWTRSHYPTISEMLRDNGCEFICMFNREDT